MGGMREMQNANNLLNNDIKYQPNCDADSVTYLGGF